MFHIPKFKSACPLHDEKILYFKIYNLPLMISSQTCIIIFGAPGIIKKAEKAHFLQENNIILNGNKKAKQKDK